MLKHFFKSIITILALCYSFQVNAQLELKLKDNDYGFKTEEYKFIGIEDTRKSKFFLGKIINANNRSSDLSINNGTERSFEGHLNDNLNQDKSGIELIIEIRLLSISEKKASNRLIKGEADMELDVYALFEGGRVLLCSPKSSSRYERSLNNIKESNYEEVLWNLWVSCLRWTNVFITQGKGQLEVFNTGSVITIRPFQQNNIGDTVRYHSRKVKWSDFKASPKNNSKFGAAIFPSIGIGTKMGVSNRKLRAEIRPEVYMLKNQSWAKSRAMSSSALKHEQIHFDIAYVVINRLIKKLSQIEANSMDDLSSHIQYQYLLAYQELNKLQEAYDKESNHNLNDYGQAKWARKVEEWLEEI